MIKKLLITYLFLITNVFAGLPPTTMRGQSQILKPTTFNFQVPNKQATITAASTSLIETGNNNELENRGFEHTTVTTGWTVSNATSSSSATRIEGSKSLSLALTGALSLSQSSTINAAQKSGVQMVASIWINSSDVSDLQLCSLKNGSEDKCTVTGGYVQGSGWRQLTVSFLGDSTSNGLKLKSTDTTGTVLVDQAYVGIGSPVVDFTPDMVYSAKVSSTGVVSAENTDWISGNAVISDTSLFTLTFASGIFSVAPSCVVSTVVNSTGGTYMTFFNQNPSVTTAVVRGGFASTGTSFNKTPLDFQIICQKQGADYKTSKAYVASSSDYGWKSCNTTLTNLGTPSLQEVQCSRDGGDLLMRGRIVIGTPSAGEARIALPDSLVSAGTSIIPSIQIAGNGVQAANSTTNFSTLNTLIEPSVGYITLGGNSSTQNGLTKANGNVIFGSGANFTFNARVPIAGWENSSVIVGSFEGIEKCANDYECTDTFSAYISSAGVVSGENLDFINGNCVNSPSGTYTCTYNTNIRDGINALTVPMNCVATSGGQWNIAFATSSTTAFVFQTAGTSGTPAASDFRVSCQKVSPDYKPKTAKVATSIGVPTVPGITTQAIETFSVSYGTTNATTACSASPCSYLDQIGNAVTSITRVGTGSYVLNFSKTYSKIKCTGSARGTSVYTIMYTSTTGNNVSSLAIGTDSGAGASTDSYGTVMCQGIPQ